MIGISGSLIWSKTLMELIFNPLVNFGNVRRAQLAKSTLLTSTLGILGSIQIFFQVSSGARVRVGCGNQCAATTRIIPNKTATLVPEFAMKDLPVGRTLTIIY